MIGQLEFAENRDFEWSRACSSEAFEKSGRDRFSMSGGAGHRFGPTRSRGSNNQMRKQFMLARRL
jgi:hypothetical protein